MSELPAAQPQTLPASALRIQNIASTLHVSKEAYVYLVLFKINFESIMGRSIIEGARGRNFGFRTAPRHAKPLGYERLVAAL